MQSLRVPPSSAAAICGVPLRTGGALIRVKASQGAKGSRGVPFRLRSVASAEPAFAGEGSSTTVFPGEACDVLGGESCNVDGVGPEVKPPPSSPTQERGALKGILDAFKPDVGTVDYAGPKTVFPGEACDELGGEFCEPDYQEGVGKEVRQ